MWKRCVAFVGGLVASRRSLLHLYSVPGYIEDGRSWLSILGSVVAVMTWQDWIWNALGFTCFFYALSIHTWPRKLKNLFIGLTATVPSSCIPANLDSQVHHPDPMPTETSPGMQTPDSPIPAAPYAKKWITKTEALDSFLVFGPAALAKRDRNRCGGNRTIPRFWLRDSRGRAG